MKAIRVPVALLVCLLISQASAAAVESDFQAVVGTIETQFGVRRTHIPMAGLARFMVRTSGPTGVHGVEFATIENLPSQPAAVPNLDAALRRTLGSEWHPFIRVRSGTRQQFTAVYLRNSGRQVRLMLATLESGEATVVELHLDAVHLSDWLQSPERMAREHGSGAGEQ